MKESNNESDISGFRREIDKAVNRSNDDFFTWFDKALNVETAFIRGNWDFGIHVLLPLAPYLKIPETKTVLDIGYGGGRMIAAASRFFKDAIGIDVHDQSEIVMAELRGRGMNNIQLFSTDGKTIPLPNASVDVVYSFIVFQHLGKISLLEGYVREIHRILKPKGLAVLYFGRKVFYSKNNKNLLLFWIDCAMEQLRLPRGYLEFQAEINHTNLLITRGFFKKLVNSLGFSLLKFVVSHKDVPDNYGSYGGQHGIVIQK